jgi:hypothetical protein
MMPARTQSLFKPVCRRAVADAALAGQVGGGGFEHAHLVRHAARGVGVAEVGHQGDLFDLRQRIQPYPRAAESRRHEAEPVHAAVHLQEHALRHVGLVGGQPVDLLGAMDHMPQTEARTQLQIARLEHAFEQQQRAAPAERAQPLGARCRGRRRWP